MKNAKMDGMEMECKFAKEQSAISKNKTISWFIYAATHWSWQSTWKIVLHRVWQTINAVAKAVLCANVFWTALFYETLDMSDLQWVLRRADIFWSKSVLFSFFVFVSRFSSVFLFLFLYRFNFLWYFSKVLLIDLTKQ